MKILQKLLVVSLFMFIGSGVAYSVLPPIGHITVRPPPYRYEYDILLQTSERPLPNERINVDIYNPDDGEILYSGTVVTGSVFKGLVTISFTLPDDEALNIHYDLKPPDNRMYCIVVVYVNVPGRDYTFTPRVEFLYTLPDDPPDFISSDDYFFGSGTYVCPK